MPTNYALESYSPVSVLTITSSPSSMNKGTRIVKPVSSSASFWAALAVSPLTPGSHLVILKVTLAGKEIPKISSL